MQISFRRAYLEILPILTTLPLVLLSISCTQILGASDAFWALRLTPGSLSYLGYGQRIVIALGSLVIQGPSVVIAPYLSETSALGQLGQFRHTTARVARMVIIFAAPTAIIVSILRIPLIELLFQRGAFDAQATAGTALILPGFLAGMVAMVIVVILLRALHSCRDLAGAALVGGIGSALYFVLSGALSQRYGIIGISMAYAVTWWLLLGLSVSRIWRGEVRSLLSADNLKFVLGLLMSVAACGVTVWLVGRVWTPSLSKSGPIGLGLYLGALAGLGGIVFLGVSGGLFRMPEIILLIQYFRAISMRKPQT